MPRLWSEQQQGPDAVAYGLADDLAEGRVTAPPPALPRPRRPLVAAAS